MDSWRTGLWMYEAEGLNVVDGDTLDLKVSLWPQRRHEIGGIVTIDMGFSVYLTKFSLGDSILQRVRLAGIDTYEVRGEEREQGLVAKAFTEDWVKSNPFCVVKTEKWKGKYGRYIAWIYSMDMQQSLNYLLLENGHGVAYG